jgi:phosphatidylinositol 3-kinase
VECNTSILYLLAQDKFRLDLSEEEAVQYMQNLIDVSATAIMAAMVERLHSLAQYWRK